MSVINMAKEIKQVHQNDLVLYKIGSFVNSFGKDAYLLAEIFDYKMKILKDNMVQTGFPKHVLPKITARLQREKINYVLIDTRNNYDVDEQEDYKNLNTYAEKLEKARENQKIKLRIQRIENFLLEEKNVELIRKIEILIYENGKI